MSNLQAGTGNRLNGAGNVVNIVDQLDQVIYELQNLELTAAGS